MPRIFTGLEIPKEVSMHLSLLQGGMQNVRWINPEFFHITLCFIGDVDNSLAGEITLAMDRIDRKPFEIRLTGLGMFGTRNPHAVWAGIEPCESLSQLQAEQDWVLRKLGVSLERRKFVPHVTLARCNGISEIEVAQYMSDQGRFKSAPFKVSRFVMYSARASVGGGPYLIEDSWELGENTNQFEDDDFNQPVYP
ncbi:MAG: RNA 2',3'-cyclic phosphodiesterase [Hyphomicrobiales bacterium]|nr:MAG: RNA 2',3'-cyclic phosphodiesterase [Hyphomicrobiales bacterium]